MNKTIVIAVIFVTGIVLLYLPTMFSDGADKIEKEIRGLDYKSLKRIECNNIKLNGRYGFDKTINDSLRIKQFYDLLKETNSREKAIGISPNKSAHHTNCHLSGENNKVLVSVSVGSFDDGSTYTSLYQSKFVVSEKIIMDTKLAELIINESDQFFKDL